MKQTSLLFALSMLMVLGACSKEKVEPTNESKTVNIVDWATGKNVGTITENVAEDRSPTIFNNVTWGATTKYSFQAKLYQGGVLIGSIPVEWVEAGSVIGFAIGEDCNELETTMVVHLTRKLPSVGCTLSMKWQMGNGPYVDAETFTIAAGGTTKTHVFPPCE